MYRYLFIYYLDILMDFFELQIPTQLSLLLPIFLTRIWIFLIPLIIANFKIKKEQITCSHEKIDDHIISNITYIYFFRTLEKRIFCLLLDLLNILCRMLYICTSLLTSALDHHMNAECKLTSFSAELFH